VGPTVIEVEPGDDAYDVEIFGPVLCVIKRDTLEDAIKVINSNCCTSLSLFFFIKDAKVTLDLPDGNGAAIFTQSGTTARKFKKSVEISQIGTCTAPGCMITI
jgi:malonate-semialdehyde dehydrogenase (acetylating) / methylmalonate-semialdehyde dehydrogenase